MVTAHCYEYFLFYDKLLCGKLHWACVQHEIRLKWLTAGQQMPIVDFLFFKPTRHSVVMCQMLCVCCILQSNSICWTAEDRKQEKNPIKRSYAALQIQVRTHTNIYIYTLQRGVKNIHEKSGHFYIILRENIETELSHNFIIHVSNPQSDGKLEEHSLVNCFYMTASWLVEFG